MAVNIDEKNLKQGLLGLIIVLVEIIRDALSLQAVKRMEGGHLKEEEIERLGATLADLDYAIEKIKEEQGLTETVCSVMEGLDNLIDDTLDKMINPRRWVEDND